MSVRMMAKVWSADVDHADLLVLLALADFADDFGGSIFPSVARIAWKTGFSVRHIQRILRDLENREILTREGKGAKGQNIWRILGDKLPMKPLFPGDPKCATSLRAQTIERFEHFCYWCLKSGDSVNAWDGKPWHIDRIVPGAKGGKYTPDNVVLSCGNCNIKRGSKEGGAILSGVPPKTIRGAIAVASNPSEEPPIKSSAHAEFINGWSEAYLKHFGDTYAFQGGKDGNAIKALLAATKLPAGNLIAIAEKAWLHGGFYCKGATSIAGFNSKFNEIRQELKTNSNGTNKKPHTANPRIAGTALEGTASQYRGVGKIR